MENCVVAMSRPTNTENNKEKERKKRKKTLVSFGAFNVYRVDVCDGTNCPPLLVICLTNGAEVYFFVFFGPIV